jgi:lipid II:glycine glycyltransferase (peptidoglycan interpeptide bridge formation enzyme)
MSINYNNYTIKKTSLTPELNNFLELSPQRSIFGTYEFLSAYTDVTISVYECYKGNERLAVLILPEDNDSNVVAPDHLIHYGIYFAPQPANRGPSHEILESFRVSEYIAEWLTENYKNIAIRLHYSISDIRPFQWVNYHNDAPMYEIQTRYTSLVNIEHINADEEGFKKALLSSRRRSINKAGRIGYTVLENEEFENFYKLYSQTFKRQGIDVDEEELALLKRIIGALSASKQLRMYTALTPESNIANIALFALEGNTAYYLYGASDYQLRTDESGSYIFWEAFKNLNSQGITHVDMEGINSPDRSYFKLSFGGNVTPYYSLTFRSDSL